MCSAWPIPQKRWASTRVLFASGRLPVPESPEPAFHQRRNGWKRLGNAKVYDHAGATEIGAWCFECEDQSGGLHVNEAFFLAEIQDVESGEYIEEPGRRGKLIITALDRQAQPCIRFDSKDIAEWASCLFLRKNFPA